MKIIKIIQRIFIKKEHPIKSHKDHVDCDFGHKEFNKIGRDRKLIEEINSNTTTTRKGGGKPPKGGGSGTSGGGGTNTTGVIFLDFDGGIVSGTSWNYNGDILCAYAGLTIEEQNIIITSVMEDYASFNVIITTDESVYNAGPANRRTRCLITETSEWYGNAGGVALIGSFTWGDNTPCFVFSKLLGYNVKYIQEAVSHEIGHTIGLYHQSSYDASCVKTAEYNSGCCGEAPIMGVSYYQPNGKWWVGPNSYGCTSIQDDGLILTSKLGLK